MKYQKAINVYEGNTLERLVNGALVLQAGQWIRCGQGPCSRYCGVTQTGTLVAAHPEGKKGVTAQHFNNLLNYWSRRAKN